MRRKKHSRRERRCLQKNFGTSTGQKWLPAVIEEVTGPVSFMVKLQDDRLVRRHLDHLRSRVDESAAQTSHSEIMSETDIDDVLIGAHLSSSTTAIPEVVDSRAAEPVVDPTDPEIEQSTDMGGSTDLEAATQGQGAGSGSLSANSNGNSQPASTAPQKTYPKRNRNPPNWYHNT